jgi:hypothetical protein
MTAVGELIAPLRRLHEDLRDVVLTATREPGRHLAEVRREEEDDTIYAIELGVIVTDASGRPLDAPLDTTTDVAWVGYANDSIRQQVEPLLQASLRRRGLLD